MPRKTKTPAKQEPPNLQALPLHPLLQALPKRTRERTRELAKALDVPELSVLSVAVHDMFNEILGDLDPGDDGDGDDDDDGERVPEPQRARNGRGRGRSS